MLDDDVRNSQLVYSVLLYKISLGQGVGWVVCWLDGRGGVELCVDGKSCWKSTTTWTYIVCLGSRFRMHFVFLY